MQVISNRSGHSNIGWWGDLHSQEGCCSTLSGLHTVVGEWPRGLHPGLCCPTLSASSLAIVASARVTAPQPSHGSPPESHDHSRGATGKFQSPSAPASACLCPVAQSAGEPTPEGWNRSARGANPGETEPRTLSTLKGLNSSLVGHADLGAACPLSDLLMRG